jgi:osomolarity two-component system response regulator SSK1
VVKIKDPLKRRITFYITHTSSPAIRNASAAVLPNANLTAQLLSYIHAECIVDPDTDKNQTKFEFSFDLDSGKKDIINKMFISKDSTLLKNHYANIKFSNEPSLKDLLQFIEHLKGLKMVLHAPEQSIFAKHLTSCLASWNTDISHVPVMNTINDESTQSELSDHSSVTTPNIEHVPPRVPTTPPVPSPAIEEEHIHSIPPAFILIDDDIATLETKLNEFRLQPAASASTLQAQHHGRRSHFHAKKPSTHQQNLFHQGTTAIIHFTSLTKYKAVRDTIQSYAFLPSRDPFSMPRVVVVPKPAGPRRFLTALHTAWHNAMVEPHFSAIATAPSSPMPPAISLWMQRELNSNVTSPNNNSTGGMTPTVNTENVSPGRRARPLSGIFSHHQSPPATTGGGGADMNNYFASQQASPSATNSGRRRSANTATPTAAAASEDYLTAKHVPLMNALGVVSPAAAAMAAAAALASPCSSNVAVPTTSTPGVAMEECTGSGSGGGGGGISSTMDSTTTSNNESPSAMLNTANNSTDVSPEAMIDGDGVSESASAVPCDVVEPAKKKLSRTMSNFKLHKKKRKAKGTPFADVVSPPINVLIVEGMKSQK